MLRRIVLIAGLTVTMAGCANLKVKKVPLDERIAGTDDTKGFRYYLSRPYVFVYERIPVAERKSLVVIEKSPEPSGAGTNLRFLDGPKRGQVVSLKDLTVPPAPGAGGAARPVTEAELASIRRVVASHADPGVKRTSATTVQDPDQTPAPESAVPDAAPLPAGLDSPPHARLLVPVPLQAAPAGSLPADALPADKTAPVGAVTTSLDVPKLSDLSTFKASDARTSAVLKGPMQIVFLPDMDEQYAIRSKNLLAKTAFALKFKEGWQLTDVGAEHDSTTVAIALLDTIDTAVNAAKDIALAGLPAPALPADVAPVLLSDSSLYYLYETTYIKPGVYRLNKPWEMDSETQAVGCGLLAKLGLTTVSEIRLLTSTEATAVDAANALAAK